MAKRTQPSKSATKLIEEAASMFGGLLQDIEQATISEVRTYLAKRLADLTKATELQNLRDCHPDVDFVPSEDFLAGLAFAAELVADPNFDY